MTGIHVPIPGKGMVFTPLHCVQTNSRAHPAYPMSTGVLSLRYSSGDMELYLTVPFIFSWHSA